MEDVSLAEDILERVEGLIRRVDGVVSDKFIITEELLYQVKDELEEIVSR